MNIYTHLYFGSAGAAGLYTKKIYNALYNNGNHFFIVNYYYLFENCFKVFFKYTENSGSNFLKDYKYLRLFIRYIEMIYGLLVSLFIILKNKSTHVNYNLISCLYVEFLFLFALKRIFKVKVILTLHDVVPFNSSYRRFFDENKIKQKIILISDYIILHNDSSMVDLKKYFQCGAKIIKHAFPLMSPCESSVDLYREDFSKNKKFFLFIGHARQEKGLGLLVKAWEELFGEYFFDASLIIATRIAGDEELARKIKSLKNVEFLNRYLSDDEYFGLIKNSDCVILPYIRGTNSGIPGTVLSLGTALICSDISMFTENNLISQNSFFEQGCVESLKLKIIEFLNSDVSLYASNKKLIDKYEIEFLDNIKNVYKEID